jgi:hypothetical protein
MNNHCIGECKPKNGTIVYNPITFRNITTRHTAMCAVDPGASNNEEFLPCVFDIKKNAKNSGLYTIGTPLFEITSKTFLNEIYKIYSVEDATQLLNNNKSMPNRTKNRILNCLWKSYGLTSNNSLIDYYYTYVKNIWIHKFYNYLCKFMHYDNDKIIILPSKDDDSKTNDCALHTNEKIEYLMNNIYTIKFITDAYDIFLEKYKDNWDFLESHHKKFQSLLLKLGEIKLFA